MGSLVRLLAIAASAVIAMSLLMFVVDQSGDGTETQLRSLEGQEAGARTSQKGVDAPNPGPAAERLREDRNSSAREFFDDGNDVLTGPFTGLAPSDDAWVERLVTAGIGLLLFGLGGLLLANWLPERRRTHKDWRQAAN